VNAPAATKLHVLAHVDVQVHWQERQATVSISGELDWATAPILSEYLSEVLDARPLRLTIDLADLEFMDCSGITPIVRARRALPADCPLILQSPSPRIRRFLAATEIDRVDGVCVAHPAR
jgi:anti-anti-sigma factor